MSYIEKNLRKDEIVHYVARPNKNIIWGVCVLLFFFSVIVLVKKHEILGGFLFLLSLGGFIGAWSSSFSEISVTNKRVVYKKGILSSIHDIPLSKVESRKVGALGKVTIGGTGVGQIQVDGLDKEKAKALIAAIDNALG